MGTPPRRRRSLREQCKEYSCRASVFVPMPTARRLSENNNMEHTDATKPLKRSEADEPPSTTKRRRRDELSPSAAPTADAEATATDHLPPTSPSAADAAAAALFEDLPAPAADPASADPCPRTLAFARSELEARGESHGLAHAKRVRALALAIYAELGGDDARVVEVAALLHDVCDHKYVDPATDAGRACIERRDRFLAEALSEADAAAVLQIVGAVSYSREAKALKKGEEPAWAALPESIRVLRHCVSDADKIDAIGVRGLERCAAYARERGVRGSLNVAREVAEHCDEKLLRLRDEYVRTAPGKRRAAPGHEWLAAWRERARGVVGF